MKDAEQGQTGARRGAVVGVDGERCDRHQSVARDADRGALDVVPRPVKKIMIAAISSWVAEKRSRMNPNS